VWSWRWAWDIKEDVQCEAEAEGELRDDGVQCGAEAKGELRDDGVQCEAKAEGELRDVGVHCKVEVEAQLREEEVQYQGVGQTEIEEDGDVHIWTESGPDDSMDESTDNLLYVSIDCDINDELGNKEWFSNVEVEVESISRGQSTASGLEVNKQYDTDVEDDVRGLSDNEWISDEYEWCSR